MCVMDVIRRIAAKFMLIVFLSIVSNTGGPDSSDRSALRRSLSALREERCHHLAIHMHGLVHGCREDHDGSRILREACAFMDKTVSSLGRQVAFRRESSLCRGGYQYLQYTNLRSDEKPAWSVGKGWFSWF